MWELIEDKLGVRTERLRVPQGWIVRSLCIIGSLGVALHQIFVRDDGHTWVLK